MRRTAKVKTLSTRVPQRKSAMTASAAVRRAFPAWIVADETGVAFPARSGATPRVRDALVLRTVSTKKVYNGKGSSDVDRAR